MADKQVTALHLMPGLGWPKVISLIYQLKTIRRENFGSGLGSVNDEIRAVGYIRLSDGLQVIV